MKTDSVNILPLVGNTITKIDIVDNCEIYFTCTDGKEYAMYHFQDCCESVTIEDINGDLQDLLNCEILKAEERISINDLGDYETVTCTFYQIATIKGTVDIRWHGYSNGYYSENVDFVEKNDVDKCNLPTKWFMKK